MARLKKPKERFPWTPFKVVLVAGLVLYAVLLFVPIIWALMTAFKEQSEFRVNIIGLPKKWVWNFSFVFKKFYVTVTTESGTERVGVARLFLNSILYAGGCAITSTIVPCVTAYLCARFKYALSKVIYGVVIIVMILPIVGNLPSEIEVARTLGIYDQIWGLWLMKAHFLGMYFLVFYNTFRAMSMAYSEAAQLDGASNWVIMTKIILPMNKNTIFTVMLINFITFWNDYQTPLIYLPSYPTLAQGMYYLANTTQNELAVLPMRMSAAILMLIPTMLLFLSFNKRLMGNLTMGGEKG